MGYHQSNNSNKKHTGTMKENRSLSESMRQGLMV
jgi:hypothetical protein